jgi:hypothetical protein
MSVGWLVIDGLVLLNVLLVHFIGPKHFCARSPRGRVHRAIRRSMDEERRIERHVFPLMTRPRASNEGSVATTY